MEEFKNQLALDIETLTSDQYVDAAGIVWPVYHKRITAAAGKFGNAGATTLAHGIVNLKLDAPFNVVRVNCSNGTITADKSKTAITADVTNLNIITLVNLVTYTGEVMVEYCKTS